MENNQQQVGTLIPEKTFIPDDNVTLRPLLSYTYYLFMRVIKNKSTWILSIIAFAMVLIIAMVPVFGEGDAGKIQLLRVMNFVGAIFVIILSMVFGTIKSLNIFTDSQSDGTELIIVSKPISRTQIIVTRYIFFIIVCLVFSVLILGGWAIGLSIVGTGLVINFGNSLGGMFAASFISQAITGVIAILIALKFSTRAARVLPIIIASLSAIVSFVPLFIPIFSQSGFTEVQYKKIDEVIKEDLAKRGESTDPLYVPLTFSGKQVKSIEMYDPNSYYNKPLEMVRNGNDYRLYLNHFNFETQDGVSYSFYPTYIEEDTTNPNPNYQDWITLYKYTTAATVSVLQNEAIPASGLVAINFVNPVSAFTSIAGVSDDNLLSSLFSGGASFAYNYNYGDFKLGSKIVVGSYDGNITYPVSITIGKHEQVDKQITVAAIWIGIFLIAVGLSALVYFRKDFK